MQLRPYQIDAIDGIRKLFLENQKKVLLHMATGGGKTVIFSQVLMKTIANGRNAIMVVRGRKLVDQASQRLIREGVDHGVMMAKHWLHRPRLPLQVCSIDTLIARGSFPRADFIVIDEAHLATSQKYKEFLSHYPDAYILGVTATPYPEADMSHVATVVLKPISMAELIEQGFLVPGRYFCPSSPDLTGVKISRSTHDYEMHDLGEAMDKSKLIGDVVDQWVKHGEGRPTIAFACTVAHSKHIEEAFKQNGIVAEHCDANTRDSERERIIGNLRTGRTKVVTNVGILSLGVDIPEASCGILARPTQSLSLYTQQVGRFTRQSKDKKDFIILDHADNVQRHGFVVDEPEAKIYGDPPKQKNDVRICEKCFAAFRGGSCPHCGELPKPIIIPTEITHREGELEEVTGQEWREFEHRTRLRDSLIAKAKCWHFKPGWVYHELVKCYGESVAKTLMKGHWR